MKHSIKPATSQITFLYFDELDTPHRFFTEVMELEMVEQQDFARIYRVSSTAFVGAVTGSKGYLRPQERNAVLVTLLVNDIEAWYLRMQAEGVEITRPLEERPDINIRCFFLTGPGNYSFEIQEFLSPALREIFHQRSH